MFVYRIEDTDGTGPYRAGVVSGWGGMKETPSGKWVDRHPGPSDDGIYDHTSNHFYGFRSIQQLRAWFWEETNIQNLQKEKFEISVYHCPRNHVLHGRKQVCFIRAEATLLRKLPIVSKRRAKSVKAA